jgi:hypothetical protein
MSAALTSCTICNAPVGRARIAFECGHSMHLHCGRPLVKAGADRCLECARALPAPAAPGRVVPLGNLALQNELLVQQMRANRAKEVRRVPLVVSHRAQ